MSKKRRRRPGGGEEPNAARSSQAGERSGGEVERSSGGGETTSNPLFVMTLILFFASGFSALIYQVIWTRLLALVFGATTFATATVLATFMGGLALGSFLAARKADAMRNPFRAYGVLEGIIGVWAVAVPFLLKGVEPIYKTVWQSAHLSTLPFGILQFVLVSLILLVPTTCMGATLPLLARFATTNLGQLGHRVGSLYASNTAGAVAGAGAAGFLLLPAMGLNATTAVAVGINLVLLVAVLWLSKRSGGAGQAPALLHGDAGEDAGEAPALQLSVQDKVVLGGFMLSGAIAMSYEIVWTRSLIYVTGAGTYAFTCMLIAFLAGIAGGSFICSQFIDKVRRPLLVVSVLQVLLAVATILSAAGFNYVPYSLLKTISTSWQSPDYVLFTKFLLSIGVLMPMTMCLGAVFPAVVKAISHENSPVGKTVGVAYALNTGGAIVGSALTGFVLLPLLGAETTLVAGVVGNLLIAVAVIVSDAAVPARSKSWVAGVLVVLAGLICARPQVWDMLLLIHAQTQARAFKVGFQFPYQDFESWQKVMHDSYRLLFCKDGITCNVGVIKQQQTGSVSLVTAGEIDGSDRDDIVPEIGLAACPLLVKPDAKSIAVVGWGTGITVGAAAAFPVQNVKAIELEPLVVATSQFFEPTNLSPEKNPLVSIDYNDARNFMQVSDDKFDVIISEPSNPWRSGVCNLFTREYFRLCRSRLNPGGVLGIWLQTGEIPPETLRSVFAAIKEAFPHAEMFAVNLDDVIVLASDTKMKFRPGDIKQSSSNKTLRETLASAHLDGAEKLLSRLVLPEDGFDQLAAGSPPNTDDFNRLEFNVAREYVTRSFSKDNLKLFDQTVSSPWKNVDWSGISDREKQELFAAVAQNADQSGYGALAARWRQAAGH